MAHNRGDLGPLALALILAASAVGLAGGAPHNQDKEPGPPLPPAESRARFEVPPGFRVELFAAEPDLVNPVAMTFDDRGRVWVAESLEYPRLASGQGADRVTILEDTDHDGHADKRTIFADGLNIPSGLALGSGGLYLANAPDLLFLKDTNGDDRADSREVLLTGFGRTDTHELPSCLTWGPDGWLYGLNGVFNHSKIEHQSQTHRFNCALWRYHPRSRAFQLFCEGTSNPWGLEYDRAGEFFVSACVIDHLWHLTESGYYHRQAGAYPRFTWKIESIVQHQHQKAAYCGLCLYDADLYPEEFRGQLFMGNIHGSRINRDALERRGTSYFATPRPDFLATPDAWFMPVAQKVGPDGCLWILDWYDRYHCYQDARRDPDGIDRGKGRLYRVTYGNSPPAPPFDLARETDAQLIERLRHPNLYFRRAARRLLVERGTARAELERLALDGASDPVGALEALWTRIGQGQLPADFHLALLQHPRREFRTWGVRAARLAKTSNPITEKDLPLDSAVIDQCLELTSDPDPAVRLQVALAARQLAPGRATQVLLAVLARAHEDESELTPRIVWRNLEPLFPDAGGALAEWLKRESRPASPALRAVVGLAIERLLAAGPPGHDSLIALVDVSLDPRNERADLSAACLERLLAAALAGGAAKEPFIELKSRLTPRLQALRDGSSGTGLGLAILLGDPAALARGHGLILDPRAEPRSRAIIIACLARTDPERFLDNLEPLLLENPTAGAGAAAVELAEETFEALQTIGAPRVAPLILTLFSRLRPELRSRALDLLAGRAQWADALLDAVDQKQVPAGEVNANQLRELLTLATAERKRRIEALWGRVRAERDRDREKVIERMRHVLAQAPGHAAAGQLVFDKVCAQCHRLYGKGHEVGPDLTNNGRGSIEQLLSNLLDPNLVIGKDYQARVVATSDGRVLTGLVVEDSADRVVLKVAGGKEEIVPRDQIAELRDSPLSLMPEKLETQLSEQEFRDLFAYLTSNPPAAK